VEAYLMDGQYDEAMRVVSEALVHVDRYGERFYESVLYRLRGEVRLRQATDAWREAEADFRRAVEIARTQGAKALELQAVISLSRCLSPQGKQTEARRMLHDITSQFSPKDDSVDLQEARSLQSEWA